VLVEELSQVTMASWSPPAWRKLSTAGRHKGMKLIGTAQRPASIDKDFLGNCTEIRCYRVNYDNDAKVMADSLNLKTIYERGPMDVTVAVKPHEQIRTLPKYEFFTKTLICQCVVASTNPRNGNGIGYRPFSGRHGKVIIRLSSPNLQTEQFTF